MTPPQEIPAHLEALMRLLTLIQPLVADQGAAGKMLSLAIQETGQRLFIPPDRKPAFDHSVKVLKSFQKSIEKMVEPQRLERAPFFAGSPGVPQAPRRPLEAERVAMRPAEKEGESVFIPPPKRPPPVEPEPGRLPASPQTLQRDKPAPPPADLPLLVVPQKIVEQVRAAIRQIAPEMELEWGQTPELKIPVGEVVAKWIQPVLDQAIAEMEKPAEKTASPLGLPAERKKPEGQQELGKESSQESRIERPASTPKERHEATALLNCPQERRSERPRELVPKEKETGAVVALPPREKREEATVKKSEPVQRPEESARPEESVRKPPPIQRDRPAEKEREPAGALQKPRETPPFLSRQRPREETTPLKEAPAARPAATPPAPPATPQGVIWERPVATIRLKQEEADSGSNPSVGTGEGRGAAFAVPFSLPPFASSSSSRQRAKKKEKEKEKNEDEEEPQQD